MGLTHPALFESDDEVASKAFRWDDPALAGVSWDTLKTKGWAQLKLAEAPFAEGGFHTPSGKCELFSNDLQSLGLPAVPDFIPPRESKQSAPELAKKYPLALLTPAAHAFLNSSFANIPKQLGQEKRPFIEIHPDDAAVRNIADGETVRAFNDRGSCELSAVVSNRARPGVVISPSVWWNKLSPDKRNVNQLTSQALTDMGGGATFYDALIEIERITVPSR